MEAMLLERQAAMAHTYAASVQAYEATQRQLQGQLEHLSRRVALSDTLTQEGAEEWILDDYIAVHFTPTVVWVNEDGSLETGAQQLLRARYWGYMKQHLDPTLISGLDNCDMRGLFNITTSSA